MSKWQKSVSFQWQWRRVWYLGMWAMHARGERTFLSTAGQMRDREWNLPPLKAILQLGVSLQKRITQWHKFFWWHKQCMSVLPTSQDFNHEKWPWSKWNVSLCSPRQKSIITWSSRSFNSTMFSSTDKYDHLIIKIISSMFFSTEKYHHKRYVQGAFFDWSHQKVLSVWGWAKSRAVDWDP